MASDRAPKPCYDSMRKQTKERVDLYKKVVPQGDPIPINVEPFDIEDLVPEDTKLRGVATGLGNSRPEGSGGIRAEHIKVWLRGIREDEEDDNEGAGDLWRKFVLLIQAIWKHGNILTQML